MVSEIRCGLRALRRAPGFTSAATLTLGLGVAASTLIFSVVYAELLRPLPFALPDQLFEIAEKNDKLNLPVWASSVDNYLSWREQSHSMESVAAIGYGNFALSGRGDPEQYAGNTITPSLFPLLGIRPVAGRAFLEGEDKPGAPAVAMLGEGLWKRRFGGDPAIVGQHLALDGRDTTVIGVAPAALALLGGGDIFTPMITAAPGNRLNHLITSVGRLRKGLTMAQSQTEMDTIFARLAAEHPEIRDWGIRLVPFSKWLVSDTLRTVLGVLMGLVTLVLLIACANVANLLLARGAARQREVAIRSALGAGRGVLIRQFLVESALLTLAGGAVGVAAGTGGIGLVNRFLPPNVLPVPDVTPDATVLLFSLAATLATGILFGIAPALFAARGDLAVLMRQGGRSATGGTPTLRNGLVALELVLATCLLICSGLLLQSLGRLERVRLGFHPEKLLTFQLSPPKSAYPDAKRAWQLYDRMLKELNATPGIVAAALSSGVPFGQGTFSRTPVTAPGESLLPGGQATPADWRSVSPGYFRTMSIPLGSGRDFDDRDSPEAPAVTVISTDAAKKMFGNRDPLGRTVRVVGSGKDFTIIGVVGGVRNTALTEAPVPAIYFCAPTRLWPSMDVVVHTQGPAEAAIPVVREVVRRLDPQLPMGNVRSMEGWIRSNAAQPRLNATLVTAFAAVALLIAVIGIYGVLSYSVAQRTREIGVRTALGAKRSEVVSLVVRHGMGMAMAGIGLGVAAAMVFGRVLESVLFEIQVRDPATYLGAAAILAAAAAVACYVPARRASRVDPMIALREE